MKKNYKDISRRTYYFLLLSLFLFVLTFGYILNSFDSVEIAVTFIFRSITKIAGILASRH